MPLNNTILFPINFEEAHDESVKKVKIIEDEETRKNIKQRYKELEKNIFNDNVFFIRPAESLEDMKDEAIQQSNCVYKNYSGKYAKGETDIYFMRKKDKPNKALVTIEVYKGLIRQQYQKYNREVTKEQEKFIQKWEEKVLKVA